MLRVSKNEKNARFARSSWAVSDEIQFEQFDRRISYVWKCIVFTVIVTIPLITTLTILISKIYYHMHQNNQTLNQTKELFLFQRLKSRKKQFHMVVSAASRRNLAASAEVIITVENNKQANSSDFTDIPSTPVTSTTSSLFVSGQQATSYLLLIHHDVPQGTDVLDLRKHFDEEDIEFTMLKGDSLFGVEEASGKVYTKQRLPLVLRTEDIWKRELQIKVRVSAITGEPVDFEIKVNIVVLPVYPGEEYVTESVLSEISSEILPKMPLRSKKGKRVVDKRRLQVVGLHRFLRTPSRRAQNISLAKLYFDRVMERVSMTLKDFYKGKIA